MTASWDDLLAKQTAATAAAAPDYESGRLAKEWVVPPFTILDSAQGYWRERRRRWLALGIESELGRGTDTNAKAAIALDVPRGDMNYSKHKASKAAALDVSNTLREATGFNGHPSYRRDADANSNLTGAGELPDYADFGMANVAPGTSIFDPVLAECCYRWFCPAGGSILDPFAGGSVRGIVAAMMGHPYTGIDLSAAQVAANRVQAARIVPDGLPVPQWYVGDSREVVPDLAAGLTFDMVFSCPPYYDLEVYSDDPADLSAMGTYAEFAVAYQEIIRAATARLKVGRFAAFVVSDIRGKNGNYVGLRRDTESFFEGAGAHLYNDAVLVNAVGTVAMRAQKQMEASRKLGRMHQNVLVFAKGEIRTHEWANTREAPPDPQQSLALEPEGVAEVFGIDPVVAGTGPFVGMEVQAAAVLDEAEPPTADAVGSATLLVVDEPIPVTADTEGGSTAPSVSTPDCAECGCAYDDHLRDTCLSCEAETVSTPDWPPCGGYTHPDGAKAATTRDGRPQPAHGIVMARPLSSVDGLARGGPGPSPPPDMIEVRPALDVDKGFCQRCGAEIEPGHEHPPFVDPPQAKALFDAGQWDRADATPEDGAAMREAGLWE